MVYRSRTCRTRMLKQRRCRKCGVILNKQLKRCKRCHLVVK